MGQLNIFGEMYELENEIKNDVILFHAYHMLENKNKEEI